MKNKYILLRHGQTIYQAKKLKFFYPNPERPPISITKKGEKQIKMAAKKLKSKGIDLIYSSGFYRARQTAGIVAKELGLRVKFDKRLRDMSFGIFRGGPMQEYRDFFSAKKQKFSKRPPKGESWRDVKKRMINFVKDIEKKHKNKTILIIGHADPLWLLKGFFKGLTERKLLEKKYNKEEIFWPDVGKFIEIE